MSLVSHRGQKVLETAQGMRNDKAYTEMGRSWNFVSTMAKESDLKHYVGKCKHHKGKHPMLGSQ